MTTFDWTERLSEYLDGSLTPEERIACEQWLLGNSEGRELLEELRAVVATAKRLPDAPVPESVWRGISAGIRAARSEAPAGVVSIDTARRPAPAPSRRRWTFSPMQFAAAAAVLLVSGTVIGTKMGAIRQVIINTPAPTDGIGRPVSTTITPTADASYDKAVQDLQTLLQRNRDQLDTATVRVLESSLAKIDAALAQAQAAVEADPHSAYLNDHLTRIRRKKLDLLRQGAVLMRAS